ncbi:MAG: cyclic lactone autoinducer peptide [Oscillospiraceae bacterium]|nr:cyclic lactone autoinducer peptide [Oscillospiraceae bacterium]
MRLGGLFASLALVLGVASSQAVCTLWFHQPKVPQGMSRFKRSR